jgi:hypothetical protein
MMAIDSLFVLVYELFLLVTAGLSPTLVLSVFAGTYVLCCSWSDAIIVPELFAMLF